MSRFLQQALDLTRAAIAFAALSLLAGAARAETVCTVLADIASGAIVARQGDCDRRMPPASTFKIPIALMGYDSGFLIDETSPRLPFRKGYPDWIESWRRDTDPRSWMANSVVWYSQEITRSLGMDRFRAYAEAFGYGNEDVSGDPGKDNGLTRSWLSSSLRISPLEQVQFLARLVNRELPVSARAHDMTVAILTRHGLPGGWTVLGKTGTGFQLDEGGLPDRRRPFGWYVGWTTNGQRTIAFARLAAFSAPRKMTPGLGTREEMLKALPRLLNGI